MSPRRALFGTSQHRTARGALVALRVLAGLTFIATGPSKVAHPAAEMQQFMTFGLDDTGLALVLFVGVVEAVGGALLLLGLLTRVAAVALAVDMVVAICTAGVHVGGPVHLLLAPLLLLVMLLLIVFGPGGLSIDERFAPLGRATATA